MIRLCGGVIGGCNLSPRLNHCLARRDLKQMLGVGGVLCSYVGDLQFLFLVVTCLGHTNLMFCFMSTPTLY